MAASTVMAQLSIRFPKHFSLLSPDEIYTDTNERMLSQIGEDRRFERKVAGVHSKELGDYICMWANTLPEGGLIAIGIEDNGLLSGCHNLSVDQLNSLEKAHYKYCPDARVESKRVEIRAVDGRSSFVLLVRVGYREDKVVRTSSGDAFIRRGDEKHRLNEAE